MIEKVRKRWRYAQNRRRRRTELAVGAPRDGPPSLELDMDSDSQTLLLVFGGMDGRVGMPAFEFLTLTGEIPVKRLFVRDLYQAWYHRGIPGHQSIPEIQAFLEERIAKCGARRLVVAGNSAGGYAAIVFGALLGSELVLSFAPQTVLAPRALHAMGDHRWDDHIKPLVRERRLDNDWSDLRRALLQRRSETRFKVFVDDTFPLDRQHAERLRGLEGIQLYRFGLGGHALVRTLRENGALSHLLRTALDAD